MHDKTSCAQTRTPVQYDIWEARLSKKNVGSRHVQVKVRPVIVISNNSANTHSPVLTVVPMTSKRKRPLPTHVVLDQTGIADERDRTAVSTALCENILSLDKENLIRHLGTLSEQDEKALARAILVQLGMEEH